MTNTDQIRAQFDMDYRRAQLDAEHAALWRSITMSNEWRRLIILEAQIAILAEMAGEKPNPPTTGETTMLTPQENIS